MSSPESQLTVDELAAVTSILDASRQVVEEMAKEKPNKAVLKELVAYLARANLYTRKAFRL